MEHPYWFGVTVEFPCEACGALSVEKFGANAPTDDIEKLKTKINAEKHYCRNCRAQVADGTPVLIGILSDTRQSLFRLGYEVPEMPGDRPERN